jgi:type I restriction enzyme S subunit
VAGRAANEQRRIVATIRSLLERVRRAAEALSAARDQLRTLDSAVPDAAVNGTLTEEWRNRSRELPKQELPGRRNQERFNFDRISGMFVIPDGWQWVRFEDVIDEGPVNGYSPKSGTDAQGTRTLRLSATTQGRMILNDATTKRVYERVPPGSRYWLRPGDLLIQRANALEYVGAAAIYDGAADTFIYPDLMMRVRIADARLREFACLFLNSEPARAYLRANATGTTGSMPKINARVLRSLPLPLPPTDEIEEILGITTKAAAASARTRDRLDSASTTLRSIQASILTAAFRGKLTKRDREEEPASALVERVHAEIRLELQSRDRSRGVRRMKQPGDEARGNGHKTRQDVASHVSLAVLLREAGGTSTPEELWRMSGLSIDAFYKALRTDVLSGAIREASDKRVLEVKNAD